MRESSKPIIGGILDANSVFLSYPIYEIPEEIQIITVAFAGRYSPCEYVDCGDVYKCYNYRKSKDMNDYIKDIMKLKKERPEIIVLFELNDTILYKDNINDSFSKVDTIIKFIKELHFDGINYRMSSYKFEGSHEQNKNVVQTYERLMKEIKGKMDKNDLFVLTWNSIGAISNTNADKNCEYFTDDLTPYNRKFLTNSKCHSDLRDASKLALSGIALPILKTLKSDIDMVVITEEPRSLPESMYHLSKDFYHSYLIYADKYNFATHVSFDLLTKQNKAENIDENMMKDLSEMVKKENDAYSRGDGITLLNVGFPQVITAEKIAFKKVKQVLS